jgi:adenylate cyclase
MMGDNRFSMGIMASLRILPEDIRLDLEEGETILQASLRAGVPHVHACGGQARCSTCRVIVLNGEKTCHSRNEKERKLARTLHFSPDIRLACQTRIKSDVICRRLVLDEEDLELANSDFTNAAIGPLGDECRLATLFADIRDFTTIAEALPPYDVAHILNRYFIKMARVIERHGGKVNNYMGDGLLALFGINGGQNLALRAVTAGLAMLDALETLQTYFLSAYQLELSIGIGIHVGSAVIGRVGASDPLQVSVVGDAVNLASRIESANKENGTRLLVSENTFAEIRNAVVIGKTLTVPLKGKSGQYKLTEILALKDS